MGATRTPVVTSVSEQALQMEHPSLEIIRARAVEVFGNQQKAQGWMQSPLRIFDGCTPEQYGLTQNQEKQRKVLTVLGQIEYGIYS